MVVGLRNQPPPHMLYPSNPNVECALALYQKTLREDMPAEDRERKRQALAVLVGRFTVIEQGAYEERKKVVDEHRTRGAR